MGPVRLENPTVRGRRAPVLGFRAPRNPNPVYRERMAVMSRPVLRSLVLSVAAGALTACGGGGSDSPTAPPGGTTTQTFMGTTRADGPTSCSGDSHVFEAAAGPVVVTLTQSTDNLTLGAQVCAGGIDNNDCTINLMPLPVGQSRSGDRRGGASQTLKLLAPNCGGGGPVPAGPIQYTATVTYQRP